MYKCTLAVVAQIALEDQGNVLSLINVIDELSAVGYPLAIPQATAVYLIERDEGDPSEAVFQSRICHNDQVVHAMPLEINFADKQRFRCTVRLNGLIVSGPGSLTFQLRKDDEVLGSWRTLAIAIAPPPAQIVANVPSTN